MTAVPGLKYKKKMAEQMNQLVAMDYLQRLLQLAVARFEWSGLPESINVRYLEQTLCQFGMAAFYESAEFGLLGLQVVQHGRLNMYNEPVEWETVNPVIHDTLDGSRPHVIVWDTVSHDRTMDTLLLYAGRLAEVERTLDVNIKAQKTPVLIGCVESQRMTLENLYMAYDGNMPVIFADDNLINKDTLKVLKTDAPYLGDKLMVYKHNVWNEALTFLGINNANTDKRERLITDEAQANEQLIMLSAQAALKSRENACKEINSMFGLSVSVKLKQELQPETVKDDKDVQEVKADG
jgi:hypothetical protein